MRRHSLHWCKPQPKLPEKANFSGSLFGLIQIFAKIHRSFHHQKEKQMKKLAVLAAAALLSACAGIQNKKNIDPQPLVLESKYNFSETVSTINQTLTQKGMTIFAQIDHQAAAQKDGLEMQAATVIIYGTPKAGTPLMIKDPSLALQLPLKVLVTEVQTGKVEVMLNTAEQIVTHSRTPYADVQNNLAKAEQLIRSTVAK